MFRFLRKCSDENEYSPKNSPDTDLSIGDCLGGLRLSGNKGVVDGLSSALQQESC